MGQQPKTGYIITTETIYLALRVVILVAIGNYFRLKPPQILMAAGASVLAGAAHVYQITHQHLWQQTDFWQLFAYIIISAAPVILLGWFVVNDPQKALKLLLIPVFMLGISLMQSGLQRTFSETIPDFIRSILGSEIGDFRESARYLHHIFAPYWILYYVFVCETILWAKGDKEQNWSVFNFNNNFSRAEASVLFYAFSLGIVGLMVGIAPIFETWVFQIMGENHSSIGRDMGMTSGVITARLVTCLLFLWWVVCYFRHFLFEFLVSRGDLPVWKFWFLRIPVLGLILWPIIMAVLPSSAISLEKRVVVFDATPSNPRLGAFKITLLIFAVLFSFSTSGSEQESLLLLISIALLFVYIWFLYQPLGFYVYLSVIVASILLQIFAIGRNIDTILVMGLFHITSVFLMNPVFHSDTFSREYIPSELDPDAEPEPYVNVLL